ncbi:MAG: glycine--tRNA ligase subunit beta [Gammaproteobacteria bacterium]
MADRQDFLVELGTEELPPRALRTLAAAFRDELAAQLRQAEIAFDPERSTWFCSPRRLAVRIAGLALAQPDREQERLGPAVAAAFDPQGEPTRAATGFAASCGVAVADLERRATDKGERLAYTQRIKGRDTTELLPEMVESALGRLPVPKRMRWGAGDAEFVRPVHWLVMLLGESVVPGSVLGQPADRLTYGHRFHAPEAISLSSPADYPGLLQSKGYVLVNDPEHGLEERISATVGETAREAGGEAVGLSEYGGLVEEVAALNEWPRPVVGHFDEGFLDLPEEVLISTLQEHQRYFPVRGGDGKLQPLFITLANIESREPEQVRLGNERVIQPRLQDARFFWEADRRETLESRRPRLDRVVFQQKLGTLADKSRRVAALAGAIAERLGGEAGAARRAAELAKVDLVTDMVGEFPELQGTMGRYYALNDGEPAAVAEAIGEQYLPRFAGDRLPASNAGRALAIADKLDTVAGIFAVGQRPSGNKDPFALRRQALGILRIIIESELDLDLDELVGIAVGGARALGTGGAADIESQVFDFFMDRLRTWYADAGVRADVFEAVLARRPTRPLDFDRRLTAVQAFLSLEAAESLAAANKRIANILRQAEEVGAAPEPGRFVESAEKALYDAVEGLRGEVEASLGAADYAAALASLARLRPEVDAFFDQVMVMAEDESVRRNRLALLAGIYDLFGRTAELALLQGTT